MADGETPKARLAFCSDADASAFHRKVVEPPFAMQAASVLASKARIEAGDVGTADSGISPKPFVVPRARQQSASRLIPYRGSLAREDAGTVESLGAQPA